MDDENTIPEWIEDEDNVAGELAEPINVPVEAVCGACTTRMTFTVSDDVDSFTFLCSTCGAESTWTR